MSAKDDEKRGERDGEHDKTVAESTALTIGVTIFGPGPRDHDNPNYERGYVRGRESTDPDPDVPKQDEEEPSKK